LYTGFQIVEEYSRTGLTNVQKALVRRIGSRLHSSSTSRRALDVVESLEVKCLVSLAENKNSAKSIWLVATPQIQFCQHVWKT